VENASNDPDPCTRNAVIHPDFARHFASEWIAAWNAHDLDRILAHYADDFEMASPVIAKIAQEPSGILRGKPAIRSYWAQALASNPDLRFELIDVLCGARSLTLLYRGHRGLSAEVFWFDGDDRVVRAAAHYVNPP